MTVKIDTERVFDLIEEKHPARIVLNAPGGLLRQTMDLMQVVEKKYGVQCVLVGDTCFGICDTVDKEVEKLGASLALHIGHNASVQEVGDYTYLVDAKDDVKFDSVVQRSIPLLSKYKRIGLATFSQHLDELEPVKKQLEAAGFEVHLGRKNNLLLGSQTFGCDFSTVFENAEKVDAFCYLGQSEFHAVGRRACDGEAHVPPRPLPRGDARHEGGGRGEAEEGDTRRLQGPRREGLRRHHGAQGGPDDGRALQVDQRTGSRRTGRRSSSSRCATSPPTGSPSTSHIEAFVQTACPRISIDGFTFGKPVLSIPQADALVGLLEGREMKDFLHRPKWIELTVGQIPRKVRGLR